MTEGRQLDWFGQFVPAAGVHHAPPAGPGPRDTVVFRRSERARRYRLSMGADGIAVATIPVRGTQREAERFVELNREWLERVRERHRSRPRTAGVWTIGTRIMWRGELTGIRVAREGEWPLVCLGSDVFAVAGLEGDLRAVLESRFVHLAKVELPGRAWELAAETQIDVTRVSVRDQRSRWGSCAASGSISLNWRLLLVPDFVRDYVIYHELAHLSEMNHSKRFWARVERLCPGWREAEDWIKKNGGYAGL